ncbi:MAG: hypothetical protein GX802_05585 [Clostridiales bacterium]|jgi:hypothetical protein|nr:hypothetical protein [Clostridiales bacterium]
MITAAIIGGVFIPVLSNIISFSVCGLYPYAKSGNALHSKTGEQHENTVEFLFL